MHRSGDAIASSARRCARAGGSSEHLLVGDIADIARIGFPLAAMHADGSFVVTKHPGTGGLVSVGTVTAQLLYEIQGHRYLNPDATARFDSIRLEQEGPDPVRVSGIRGEPPPTTTKVCINYLGGYRNAMTFVLTGLDIAAKAETAERTLWRLLGGKERFAETHVQLVRDVDVLVDETEDGRCSAASCFERRSRRHGPRRRRRGDAPVDFRRNAHATFAAPWRELH